MERSPISQLSAAYANELIASVIICIHAPDFADDKDDKFLREYVSHVVDLAIQHRRKHTSVYHWPGLSSDQVENLKKWTVEQVIRKIRKI